MSMIGPDAGAVIDSARDGPGAAISPDRFSLWSVVARLPVIA